MLFEGVDRWWQDLAADSSRYQPAETNHRPSDPVGDRANDSSVDLDLQYHFWIEQISELLHSTFMITLYSFARINPGYCRRRSVKNSGARKYPDMNRRRFGDYNKKIYISACVCYRYILTEYQQLACNILLLLWLHIRDWHVILSILTLRFMTIQSELFRKVLNTTQQTAYN